MLTRALLFLIVLLPVTGVRSVFSQTAGSLQALYKTATHDTARCRILHAIIEAEADEKHWPRYNEQLEALAAKNLGDLSDKDICYPVFQKYLGAALNNKAVILQNKGKSAAALPCYFKSLRLRESAGDTAGIGETLNNIGLIYHAQGNIPMAIDYYQRSLKFQELIHDVPGMSTTILNLGVISSDQGDLNLSHTYFLRSYALLQTTGDDYGKAYCLNNLANSYQKRGELQKADSTYRQSLALREKIQDTKGIAYSCLNLGVLQTLLDSSAAQKKIPEELYRSLSLFRQLEDKEGIANVLFRLGQLFFKNNDFQKARRYAEESYTLSRELGYPENIRNASGLLYTIYKASGHSAKALEMYELYSHMRDSIFNESLRRISLGKQFQYEFDKRVTADSVKAAEQQKVMAARISKERTQRIAVTSLLVLTIVFSGFVMNRWNIIRKQKKQIQEQHAELRSEKKKSDDLLLNILPEETAEELKKTGNAQAMKHEDVSVMFVDFANFTKAAEQLEAEELVNEIHYCYSNFDQIISAFSIEKIKTIGDGYMCAAGLPLAHPDHALTIVKAALQLQRFMQSYKEERVRRQQPFFEARIGIHSGPVVSGVVGIKKFAYDIWGDTVNIAARMESSGVPGRVNISEATYEKVKDYFRTEFRGMQAAKNMGDVKMYFVLDEICSNNSRNE